MSLSTLATSLLKFFGRIEILAAKAQGKGYDHGVQNQVKTIRKLLGQTPNLAIDIGANVGAWTVQLRKTFPNLEVHMFEPANSLFNQLNTRFFEDDLIYVLPFAVSDERGKGCLYFDKDRPELTSLTKRRLDHFNIYFDRSENVDVICFEDYWNINLERRDIDFIKIDVEGYELAVLRGMGQAINFIKVIQFEFGGTCIDTKTYFQDFWYFFEEHNFEIYRFTFLGLFRIATYREIDETLVKTDFLAVRKTNLYSINS